MERPYGAEYLRELLTDFENALTEAGAGSVLEALQPGAPADEVQAAFAEIGMTAPEEVVTWFGWSNSEMVTLLPQWEPITLEQAINEYKEQDEIGTEPWQWQPGWVPILSGTHWVIVNCSGPSDDPAPVRELDTFTGWEYKPLNEIIQPSLCVPVIWWTEAIRDGTYRWLPEQQRWTGERHHPLPSIRTGLA